MTGHVVRCEAGVGFWGRYGIGQAAVRLPHQS